MKDFGDFIGYHHRQRWALLKKKKKFMSWSFKKGKGFHFPLKHHNDQVPLVISTLNKSLVLNQQ